MKVTDICKEYELDLSEFIAFASERGALNGAFGEEFVDDEDVIGIVDAYKESIGEIVETAVPQSAEGIVEEQESVQPEAERIPVRGKADTKEENMKAELPAAKEYARNVPLAETIEQNMKAGEEERQQADKKEEETQQQNEQNLLHEVIAPSSTPATEETVKQLLDVAKKIHFWIKFWSVILILVFTMVAVMVYHASSSLLNSFRY